jgi:tetratricopeptide (TPR) repeat protein
LGKFEDAIKCDRKAIGLDASFAAAYNGVGAALERLGRYDEAIDYYCQAISKDPDWPGYYHNIDEQLISKVGLHKL